MFETALRVITHEMGPSYQSDGIKIEAVILIASCFNQLNDNDKADIVVTFQLGEKLAKALSHSLDQQGVLKRLIMFLEAVFATS